MFSMNRMFIGVAIYLLFLFGIIAVLMITGNPVLYVILLFAVVGIFLVAMYTGFLTKPGNYDRLMAHGEDGTATVLGINDTGVTINNSPYVRLHLKVESPGRPAFEKTMNVEVSRLAIPRVGDTLNVKIDPNKPEEFIIP